MAGPREILNYQSLPLLHGVCVQPLGDRVIVSWPTPPLWRMVVSTVLYSLMFLPCCAICLVWIFHGQWWDGLGVGLIALVLFLGAWAGANDIRRRLRGELTQESCEFTSKHLRDASHPLDEVPVIVEVRIVPGRRLASFRREIKLVLLEEDGNEHELEVVRDCPISELDALVRKLYEALELARPEPEGVRTPRRAV